MSVFLHLAWIHKRLRRKCTDLRQSRAGRVRSLSRGGLVRDWQPAPPHKLAGSVTGLSVGQGSPFPKGFLNFLKILKSSETLGSKNGAQNEPNLGSNWSQLVPKSIKIVVFLRLGKKGRLENLLKIL